MFSFGPAFDAETAYQTERRREAAGVRPLDRDRNVAGTPVGLLGRSPLSELVALVARLHHTAPVRRADRGAVGASPVRAR